MKTKGENMKKKPHFRVVVSVIETGEGVEMVYSTTIKECSLPACKNFNIADKRAEQLIKYYTTTFQKGK